MCRKLLKKAALFAMAAALCVGAFVPMTAKAAEVSASFLAGDWYSRHFAGMEWNGHVSDGMLHFKDDGTYDDMWRDSKKYHLEGGSLNIEGDEVSFDFWGGWPEYDTIDSAKGNSNVQIFILRGDNRMEYGNLVWSENDSYWVWNDTTSWTRVAEGGSDDESDEDEETEEEAAERKALEEAHREAVRLEKEAAEQGFENAAQMQEAQSAGKSAAEYYNNAVVTTGGIDNAVPVAQGGQLIIDGEVTNASATVSKVSSVYVDSVRAAREGRLLNVVDVRFPAHEAVVNFYMPGIEAGDTVTAVQFTDGTWTDVEVVEVRTDHVLLKLMRSGVVAFLEK